LTEPPSVIDVAYWHETDLPRCPQLGRYREESRHGVDCLIRSRMTQSELREGSGECTKRFREFCLGVGWWQLMLLWAGPGEAIA
jgi:hypothetical protein